jgi:hypothetical protein
MNAHHRLIHEVIQETVAMAREEAAIHEQGLCEECAEEAQRAQGQTYVN